MKEKLRLRQKKIDLLPSKEKKKKVIIIIINTI